MPLVHRDYAITGSKILLEVFSQHVDVSSPGTVAKSHDG